MQIDFKLNQLVNVKYFKPSLVMLLLSGINLIY